MSEQQLRDQIFIDSMKYAEEKAKLRDFESKMHESLSDIKDYLEMLVEEMFQGEEKEETRHALVRTGLARIERIKKDLAKII